MRGEEKQQYKAMRYLNDGVVWELIEPTGERIATVVSQEKHMKLILNALNRRADNNASEQSAMSANQQSVQADGGSGGVAIK